jgi:hypothetical protein
MIEMEYKTNLSRVKQSNIISQPNETIAQFKFDEQAIHTLTARNLTSTHKLFLKLIPLAHGTQGLHLELSPIIERE